LRKVRQTHQPNAEGYFKTKTQAGKALWVTLVQSADLKGEWLLDAGEKGRHVLARIITKIEVSSDWFILVISFDIS